MKEKVVFIVALIMSIIYILIGNKIAMKNNNILNNLNKPNYSNATITRIIERKETPVSINGENDGYNIDITFEAKISSGKQKDTLVIAVQNIATYIKGSVKEVSQGDKILIHDNSEGIGDSSWTFVEYSRTSGLIVLGIIFLGLILLFGRKKE